MSASVFAAALFLAGAPVVVEPVAAATAQPAPVASADAIAQPPAPAPAADATEPASSPPATPAPVPASPAPASPAPASPAPASDEIVVSAHGTAPDPMQSVNAETFALTQNVDRAVTGPLAIAYKRNIPSPIRGGLRHFLSNLNEPVVFLNFLLQFKPGKAAETVGRFALNSTIGVAGLIDVAKTQPFNLPHRPNGFAYTMGYYGVKPGAYLYLPLIGPTTVRDLIGGGLDRMVVPLAVGSPFNKLPYSLSTGLLSSLDRRAELDEQYRKLEDENGDLYVAYREFYLQKRQAEIDALHSKRKPKAALPLTPSLTVTPPPAVTQAKPVVSPEAAAPPEAATVPQAIAPPPVGDAQTSVN